MVPTYAAGADEDRVTLRVRTQWPQGRKGAAGATRLAGFVDISGRRGSATVSRRADSGRTLVVVLRIHVKCERNLLRVAEAGGRARLLPHLGEDREEDGGENGDNGDHDEQFDEREAATRWGSGLHRFVSCDTDGVRDQL